MKNVLITVSRGEDLVIKNENGRSSDPYVRLTQLRENHLDPGKSKIEKKSAMTKVKKKNLNPTWNEVFKFTANTFSDSILLECFNWNRLGRGDSHIAMGCYELKLNEFRSLGNNVQKSETLTLEKVEKGKISISIEFQEIPLIYAKIKGESRWIKYKGKDLKENAPYHLKYELRLYVSERGNVYGGHKVKNGIISNYVQGSYDRNNQSWKLNVCFMVGNQYSATHSLVGLIDEVWKTFVGYSTVQHVSSQFADSQKGDQMQLKCDDLDIREADKKELEDKKRASLDFFSLDMIKFLLDSGDKK